MRKIIASAVVPSVIMFFAGKQYKQRSQILQSSQKSTKDQQSISQVANFFNQQTVVAPIRRIHYPHYTIIYSTYHKSPLAVHQIITKQLASGDAPRADFFFPDQNIQPKHFQVDQSYYRDTQAYKRFNINRGHMAAAGNYSGDQSEKFHTFTFSNVIPQDGSNNGGIWNTFQRYARNLAINHNCETVEIISGPIFVKNNPFSEQLKKYPKYYSKLNVLKQNGIPIPQKLYKIIKCNSKEGSAFLNAFQFQNAKTQDNDRELESFKVELKSVQDQTGLKFNLVGKELKDLSGANINSKKRQLDKQFYQQLISDSKSLKEMNNSLSRAQGQKIDIELQKFTKKITTMAQNQTRQIVREQSSDCTRFNKLLLLQNQLKYLKHTDKTDDITSENLLKFYKSCFKKPQQSNQQLKMLQQISAKFKEAVVQLQKLSQS